MKHIDLFSGIGGFALAAREVWGDEYENVCFCEINKYAQVVLRKNFGKGITIYGDIRTLTNSNDARFDGAENPESGIKRTNGDEKRPNELRKPEGSNPLWPSVDLITGGFPCQPFSQAGKRKGTNDDRYLWPEMLRVIREFKPTWVVAENVRGLLTIEDGVVFEQVCVDLENEGYEVQPFVIPACAVNAPHRRDRVWIVAHHASWKSRVEETRNRWQSVGGRGEEDAQNTESQRLQRGNNGDIEKKPVRLFPTGSVGDASDSTSEGREHGRSGEQGDALNAQSARLPDGDAGEIRRPEANEERERSTVGHFAPEQWNANWLEVATRFCGVDDGLPGEMDGTTLSKAKHRVERLKGLGNAIVPQVAVQIFRGLKMANLMEQI